MVKKRELYLRLNMELRTHFRSSSNGTDCYTKTRRLDLQVAGPGNIEVGAQYSWMGLGDGNTHFSFGNLIEIPVGPVVNGLTEGFIEVQPFIILARDFPELNQSQIFFEFGFDWVDQIRKCS